MPDPSSSPRVVLQGSLKLSRPLEDRLMKHLEDRHKQINVARGFNGTARDSWEGWLGKRRLFERMYQNDFDWRKTMSALHKEFNTSENVPKRGIRIFAARARELLLDADPFTGIIAEGDDEKASEEVKLAEQYFHRKLRDCEARYHYRDIVEPCGVFGEVVMKHIKEPSVNRDAGKPQSVWLSGGAPLRDSRGQWVFEHDEWEDDPAALEPDSKQLKRDPAVKRPADAVLSETKLPYKETVRRTNLSIKNVGYEDFGCDPTARDIHTADTIFQEFDMSLDSLWDYTNGVQLRAEAAEWLQMVETGATGNAESAGAQPQRDERERGADAPKQLRFAETWHRFDVHDRKRAEEICVLWDVNRKFPIYYDYLQEVSQSGRRPYEVARILPVRDRWYGMGFYELLSDLHPFIDRQINRIDARNGSGGRLTYMKKGTFIEERLGIPISLNSPRIYTLEETVSGKIEGERFGHVAVPQMDEKIWLLLNNAKQTAQLMMGTLMSGDADNSHAPSNKTATGQTILQNESELMSSDITQDMIRGLVKSLEQALLVVFHEFDAAEANLILGEGKGDKLKKWLESNRIEDLLLHLRLLLTKTRSKAQFEANKQAMEIAEKWLSLITNPMLAPYTESLRPGYKAMIKSLDFSNADAFLPKAQPMNPPPDPAGVQPTPANVLPVAA